MMNLSSRRNERIGFNRIVCPVDLTPDSDEALRYAVALAKDYRAKLSVLHCIGESPVVGLEARVHTKKNLERLVKKHTRSLADGELDWLITLIEGEPADAIAARAAELSADLIVMRSKRRPNSAALLGSTAEALSRIAPCPVFVSHPREKDWAGDDNDAPGDAAGLKRVLVAYDFSTDAELALAYGLSLAQEYQAELHLLHVLPTREGAGAPELSFLPYVSGKAFEEASLRLSSVVPHDAYAWCEIRQGLRAGQPYREVLSYAEEEKIDLICIGASGTDHGMRALFGSNTDRVLRQSPCPVLIARPLRPAQRPVLL